MPFAAALWFLLLHALAGTALPAMPAGQWANCHEAASSSGSRHAVATPPHHPAESVRASYAAPITAVARPSWRAPATGVPVLVGCAHAAQLELAFTARTVLRRADDEVSRSARDARFLAYFPTAPPYPA